MSTLAYDKQPRTPLTGDVSPGRWVLGALLGQYTESVTAARNGREAPRWAQIVSRLGSFAVPAELKPAVMNVEVQAAPPLSARPANDGREAPPPIPELGPSSDPLVWNGYDKWLRQSQMPAGSRPQPTPVAPQPPTEHRPIG